ncbi:MAG TPA: DUF4912 domain-containing protein, partial [Myxococcales bacterium]|nr:DUF4912 domain-containing protein [Myxococcales bacterium]
METATPESSTRPPEARAPGATAQKMGETAEMDTAPAASAGAQPAPAPRLPPRRVDVTAFPSKPRPPRVETSSSSAPTPPPRSPSRHLPSHSERPPRAAAPRAAAPAAEPSPPRAPAAPPPAPAPAAPAPPPPVAARERPRAPVEPTPRWVEAPDVLVEGFFLTPEPRHPQVSAEPVGEGFFVARVAGEAAARRHGLTGRSGHVPPGAFEEDLGELPVSYGDDDVLALPRDPHSLFFFWNFDAARAPEGARAVLRVFDGDQLIRELELTSEQRSFYLHDLPAGRTYRLEAHLIDASGASRLIGQARLVSLPGEGSVRTAEVRFLKLPWHLALARLREYMREGTAHVEVVQGKEAFAAWIRTPLPTSRELHEGIASERAAAGEGVEGVEAPGNWRPSPSGQ